MKHTIKYWESLFCDYISLYNKDHHDASHDISHFQRVYRTAQYIAHVESAPIDLFVLLAAAYFHDIVSLPKDHPENAMSSCYAAMKAKEILHQLEFPKEKIDPVCHAIMAHSFSAGLHPETQEAKIIQDADRMEALGAIGAMRVFYVSGRMGRAAFDPEDLHATKRPLDDKMFGVDHFYVKLFKLPHLLQTKGGQSLAHTRVEFLRYFLSELDANVKDKKGGALLVTNACRQAGSQGLLLFDTLNPLARSRELHPHRFVIDQLIEAREKFPVFIQLFLSQFQQEVETSVESCIGIS